MVAVADVMTTVCSVATLAVFFEHGYLLDPRPWFQSKVRIFELVYKFQVAGHRTSCRRKLPLRCNTHHHLQEK